MQITFVTGNKNKFEEAIQIIPGLTQKSLDLVEIQEIDSKKVIVHKLEEARKVLSGNIVVEDNAFYLEAINGLPGPLIKWFQKTIGNEGLVSICDSFKNHKAIAKVTIGFSKENGDIEFFEGSIEGEIVKPRGENGFDWDAIFQPTGYTKTFGEMTREEKNSISMRKIAFEKLKNSL